MTREEDGRVKTCCITVFIYLFIYLEKKSDALNIPKSKKENKKNHQKKKRKVF